MRPLVRLALFGLLVLAAQHLVFEHLRLWGAYPDVVLLFLALFALRFGRLQGAVAGFVAGFFMDVLNHTWGAQMLVKTLVGFSIGFVPVDRRGETLRVTVAQAALGGLGLALLHNGLLVILQSLDYGTRNTFILMSLWFGSALYTAAIAALAAAVAQRRYSF